MKETLLTTEEYMQILTNACPDLGAWDKRTAEETIAKTIPLIKFREHPNWSYCIPLGVYIDPKSKHFDLGVFLEPPGEFFKHTQISANIVTSNDGPDYCSGTFFLSNNHYKKLGIILNRLGILSDSKLRWEFAEHNGIYKKLLFSNKISIWDVEKYIIDNA